MTAPKTPLDRDVATWTRIFIELGVSPSTAASVASTIRDLYERLCVAYPGLQPRQVFRAVMSGIFTSFLPAFSPERVADRAMAGGDLDPEQLPVIVEQELTTLLTSSGVLVSRMESALLAREEMSDQVNDVLGRLKVMLDQQHQVLRRHYPFGGEGMMSVLLGTRGIQEHLIDDLLPRVYNGLDEVVKALRASGNWVSGWDGHIRPLMNLEQTQALFRNIGRFVSVLDDNQYGHLKKLYRAKWEELDGRMLAAGDTKFCWRPKV